MLFSTKEHYRSYSVKLLNKILFFKVFPGWAANPGFLWLYIQFLSLYLQAIADTLLSQGDEDNIEQFQYHLVSFSLVCQCYLSQKNIITVTLLNV